MAKRKKVITAILLVLSLIIVVIAACSLTPIVIETSDYQQLSSGGESAGGSDDFCSTDSVNFIDWDYLRSINSDVVAWVSVNGTNIDYPVVQSDDNYEYVNKNFWGGYSFAGCPFLDYRSSADGEHALVYGHNLAGIGTMFSSIHDSYDQSSFDQLGTVHWSTPDVGTIDFTPVMAMKVSESYQPIQTFDFDLTIDEKTKALEELSQSRNVDETIADASVNSVEEIANTDVSAKGAGSSQHDADKASLLQQAKRDKLHRWLFSLLQDSSASSLNAESLINQSSRVVTLVSCSSDWAGQPWRTLFVCVA